MSNFPYIWGKLTLWLVPLSLNLMNYWQQRLDSMTLLFLLPRSELMYCGNPSQHSPPLCGAGGRVCRRTEAGVLRAFGSKGQACTENLISLNLPLRGEQPDPGAEGGRGWGRWYLKEQRILGKENSVLGALWSLAPPHLGRVDIGL